MGYDGAMIGPRVVAYNLASHNYEYLMRAVGLGVFEGPLGDMKIPPQVQEILDALHTVLAGGDVEVKVKHRGNPDIVNELANRLREAVAESNEINKKAGFYLTAIA
jgi:hypothetical protein